MNITVSFFLFLWSFSALAQSWSFDFNEGFGDWGTWGDGLASIDKSVGRKEKGSVRLSTDYGSTQTMHFSNDKIPNGKYLVSFFIRAENILSDKTNYSFWHFFDLGEGTQDVFTNLSGSYEWRKVAYTIDVSQGKLLLWLRLKSTGMVWIDDLTITKASSSLPLHIDPVIPLNRVYQLAPIHKKKGAKKTLLDFENHRSSSPFAVSVINQSKMGRMKPHKFYDFKPSEFAAGDWSSFDYLNLEVFNPNSVMVPFSLTLGDAQSSNYWTELNHKSSLAPGLNKLSFPLKQFVGERGSHRFNRYLNLKSLKKWFVIVDADKKLNSLQDLWIDNISLEEKTIPKKPLGVWAYDFTSHKNDAATNATKVYSFDLYHPARGYGFIDPLIWRVEDSIYAPSDLRFSIGINKGSFKVKLPNGKYTLFLNMERLGYWDVSFWSNREIYLNDKIVLKETRSDTQDFLKDYLMFSSVNPGGDDHPYDLYLDKIFKYYHFDFEIKDGELDIGFIADATGISLNHLVIAKKDQKHLAQEYLSSLKEARRSEFDRISRKIPPEKLQIAAHTKLIDLQLDLREDQSYPEQGQAVAWSGVQGEGLYQVIELRGEGPVSFKVEGGDEAFFRHHLKIHEIVPQIISPDLNHETYFYGGKYLKPFTKLTLSKENAKFILIEIKHSEKTEQKLKTHLVINIGKESKSFPLSLHALPLVMPSLDFPVGFFGPDPLPFNHLQSLEFSKTREDYRMLAIEKLAEAGFTTFTGLPAVYQNGEMDLSPLNRLVNHANAQGMGGTYFSYGGDFPGLLIDQDESVISQVLSKVAGRLVYTFSDEPGGYSNKISQDLDLAKKLKRKAPLLLRGGFTNLDDKNLSELNGYFDFPFYSHVKKGTAKKWGAYNAAAQTLSDPRFVLSAGLFYARQKGLTHYLEWHSSAIHNYPYYELDGRESDIELFMAAPHHNLYPTVKFIMARQGIQTLRKIILLQQSMKKTPITSGKAFLNKLEKGHFSQPNQLLMPSKDFNFEQFQRDLNQALNSLSNN